MCFLIIRVHTKIIIGKLFTSKLFSLVLFFILYCQLHFSVYRVPCSTDLIKIYIPLLILLYFFHFLFLLKIISRTHKIVGQWFGLAIYYTRIYFMHMILHLEWQSKMAVGLEHGIGQSCLFSKILTSNLLGFEFQGSFLFAMLCNIAQHNEWCT